LAANAPSRSTLIVISAVRKGRSELRDRMRWRPVEVGIHVRPVRQAPKELLDVVFLSRRFTRAFPCEPWACHVAAALAVTIGAANVITGAAHSFAVASLALREPGYGPVQILRFTTGAIMLYSGAMNIVVYRGIRAGRGWAIGVAGSTALLFCLYLVFMLPLPGTGGSVPRELVLWTFYVGWLGAAAFASQRADRSALPSARPAAA
jgi:hypothetical protein